MYSSYKLRTMLEHCMHDGKHVMCALGMALHDPHPSWASVRLCVCASSSVSAPFNSIESHGRTA